MYTDRIIPVSGVVLALAFICACSGPTLSEYEAHSRAEAEIRDILLEYLAAKRIFDIERYLACLHDEGRYHFECGRIVTKAELAKLLPAFWADLRSGDPAFYPINRECITGDYFETGRYVNPRMRVDRDRAGVVLKFTVGWWGLHHQIALAKEGGRWLITGLDWEMNQGVQGRTNKGDVNDIGFIGMC